MKALPARWPSLKSRNFPVDLVFNNERLSGAQALGVMRMSFHAPSSGCSRQFPNVPIRVGIYTGICLSIAFVAWVLIANRAPVLEPLAAQRNVAAAIFLIFLAAMPVLRFLRQPGDMLVSSLVAWTLLTLTYTVLTFSFSLLEHYYSTFHVFVLGVVVYLLFAALSWVGMMVWRARAAEHTHHSR